ncbi:phage tail tube protein [Vogesella indigofera]|uniref:phage tail tube protein n=1 Tax=Vogesella indigofera TaxID=45465 RepID=UPI0035AF03B0
MPQCRQTACEPPQSSQGRKKPKTIKNGFVITPGNFRRHSDAADQATIKLNGATLRSKLGASLKVGGPIKKAETDSNGFAGHSVEEIKPGEIKCTLLHTSDTDVVALQQISDATVVFETDSGQTYLVRQAGTEGEAEMKGKEIDITFTGAPAELV